MKMERGGIVEKKGLSHEGLKVIACITMLLDHIGAIYFPGYGLRIIGRIAFPIYCYLLVEGAAHTRNPKKYATRLLIGALLAELPFDYLFYGGFTVAHQSVMVTLLLGLVMIVWARKRGRYMLPLCVCFFAAELLNGDYGCWGIGIIALFMVTAEKSREKLLQVIGLAVIFLLMGSYKVPLGGIQIPIQLYGLLAMIPIALYSGRKITVSKTVQWIFYLFYPVHLLILLLIGGFWR